MAAQPNIVFVRADDIGYEYLSSYGSADYVTPCLDARGRVGFAVYADSFSTLVHADSRADHDGPIQRAKLHPFW